MFEIKLLKCILELSDGSEVFHLSPSIFTDSECRRAFSFIKGFVAEHGRVPTIEELDRMHSPKIASEVAEATDLQPSRSFLHSMIDRAKIQDVAIKSLQMLKENRIHEAFEVFQNVTPTVVGATKVSEVSLNGTPQEPLDFDYTPLKDRIKPGTLNLLLGPTNVGKSFFLVNLAAQVSKRGKTVVFISLELPMIEVCKRIAACVVKKPINEIQENDIKKVENIYLLQMEPQQTHVEELNCVRRLKPDLVLIDYADLFWKSYDIRGSLIRIFYWLKGFANSSLCAVFTVSQVNRSGIYDKVSIVHTAECIDKVFVSDYVYGMFPVGFNTLLLKTLKARSSAKAPDVILEYDFRRAQLEEQV